MKIKLENFSKWFNRDFWRAFSNRAFPIAIPANPEDRIRLVEEVYSEIESARYAPMIPEAEMLSNKGHGVTRTIPVFCIKDYCVYYFCVKELENILCFDRTENTFGGWSLGGKLRAKEQCDIECEVTDYGRYSFNPYSWSKAFGEFNSLLYAQIDTGSYSHVLQFDLANFYDSIRLDTLERSIRESDHENKGWIITLLFYFLNHWNRKNTGLHRQAVGLPQDALADCSRILANFYLQRYDAFAAKVCAKAGGLYFRYSDDQMILLNDPSRKEGILLLLTRHLDRFGLRVNQKKVELWTVEDLQQYRFRRIVEILAPQDARKQPDTVRKFVEEYLAIPVDDLQKKWNSGIPLLKRLLWANIESLPEELFEPIMNRLESDAFLLIAGSGELGKVFELNSKRREPIDFRDKLISLGRISVHNAFHHEVFAFARAIKDQELLQIFQERLHHLAQQMAGDEIL